MVIPKNTLTQRLRVKTIKETYEYFDNLASSYGAKYINLANLFNEAEYFISQDHLNMKGAKIFTKIVKSKCFN